MIKIIAPIILGIILMSYTSKLNKKMSRNGIDFLKFVEGEKLAVYTDEAGYLTIGVGHKIKDNENFTFISQDESTQLLRNDLKDAERAVDTYVNVPLNQNQYDALVSFVFNVGSGAFSKSTLLEKINAYDYSGALSEFPHWNKVTIDGNKVVSDGLVKRRELEQELFNT